LTTKELFSFHRGGDTTTTTVQNKRTKRVVMK